MRRIVSSKINEDTEELLTRDVYQTNSDSSLTSLIQELEGYKIRIREIHWSTSKHSEHVLTDGILKELDSFEDSIAEQVMGLNGFRVAVAEISNVVFPDASLLKEVLTQLLNTLIKFKTTIEKDPKFSGVISLIDDFMGNISKYLYLETFD